MKRRSQSVSLLVPVMFSGVMFVSVLFQGGRMFAGSADEPFRGQLHITLRGNHRTPDWPLPNGPNQGSKVLGKKNCVRLKI